MSSGFSSLGLSPSLLTVLQELSFTEPTPIQQKCIPALLAGNDLVGQSKTGSGKTAAFALPILERINVNDKVLQALIVCPTRELADQVARQVRTLGRKQHGLQVALLCGGQPTRPQIKALTGGVHIAVGTPGRLLDHLQRQTLDLQNVCTAVLDEADRMFDMGFSPQVEIILEELPQNRQTVFFSAT